MAESILIMDDAVLAQLRADVGDDAMPMLFDAFGREITKSIATIRTACDAGNLALVETTAHALKSAAASFGALQLRDVCRSIEFGVRENCGPDDLVAMLEKLDGVAGQTRTAFRL